MIRFAYNLHFFNLFLGMQFRRFGKFRAFADNKSSLTPEICQKLQKPHRHYFDCRFVQSTNLAKKLNQKSLLKFLLRFAFAKSRISLLFRHCEANRRFAEAIQNFCDNKNDKNQSTRSAKPCPTRHTEATKSPKYPLKSFCFVLLSQKVEFLLPLNHNLPIVQGKKIVCDSQVAKMDSLLRTSCYAQNDESFLDCHDLPLPNRAMANPFHNPQQRLNRAF